MFLRWMASVCFGCSALLKTAWEEAGKRFGLLSLWPRPRWEPLAWAGAVRSCKAAARAEINEEKQALGYKVGKSRQETQSVQHRPRGLEGEQMQLSFRSDGKQHQDWKLELENKEWIEICWTEKGPEGPAWKLWDICHFNPSCWVSSVSNVALLQFAFR